MINVRTSKKKKIGTRTDHIQKQNISHSKKRITTLVGVDCLLAMLLFSNTFIHMSCISLYRTRKI